MVERDWSYNIDMKDIIGFMAGYVSRSLPHPRQQEAERLAFDLDMVLDLGGNGVWEKLYHLQKNDFELYEMVTNLMHNKFI